MSNEIRELYNYKYKKENKEKQDKPKNNSSSYFTNPKPKPKYEISKMYTFSGSEEVNKQQQNNNLSSFEYNKPKDKTEKFGFSYFDKIQWDNADKEVERDWYNTEETQVSLYSQYENKTSYGNFSNSLTEKDIERKKLSNPISRRVVNKYDSALWEINQLKNSGVVKERVNENDDIEEDNTRIVIQSIDRKPLFLADNEKFNFMQNQIFLTLGNEEQSEMMKIAKKGSSVLKELRERNEKSKNKENFDQLESKEAQFVEEAKLKNLIPSTDNQLSSGLMNKTLKEQKEYLPIFSVKKELLNLIRDNKIVIIVGETGSGKTTQLTQYLYEEGYFQTGIIGCTQPRRVAAVSVAKRVSEEMDSTIGDTVGYSIRFEDITSKNTKIKYMTDGVLLRESLIDPNLEKYSAIIMDEAHERSLNTDVLFGILRKVIENRRDLKLIVTSATMNAAKFSTFFSNAPIYTIPGRTYKVDVIYSKSPCEDYVESAVMKALTIHLQYGDGDILIFMTGQEDIEATVTLMQEKIDKDKSIPNMLLLPIYSQLPSDLQSKIFEKSAFRKCIVATNIAETSLTLDGVKFVIDTGFHKVKVYNPRVGMDILQVNPISQANANQRAGRAGRTGPGVCFRLYTEAAFKNDLKENNIPEIQRTNLCNVVLLLKSLKIENILSFDFMDPPSQESILSAMYQLWMLGALNEEGYLTDLGKKMVEFPLDPTMSKLLIMSNINNCSSEILTIVSMLSVQTIFYRPKGKEAESDKAREKFYISDSDHLTLLNVYTQWKSSSCSVDWSNSNYINCKSLKKVSEVRKQLSDIMIEQKMRISSCEKNFDSVKKTIVCGYFHNTSKLKGIGEYVNIRANIPCVIHPSSAIYSLGYSPDYVVYNELIMTNKEYMSCVTVIDPLWLIEVAPMFFSQKTVDRDVRLKNEKHQEELNKLEQKIRLIQKKRLGNSEIKDIIATENKSYKQVLEIGGFKKTFTKTKSEAKSIYDDQGQGEDDLISITKSRLKH